MAAISDLAVALGTSGRSSGAEGTRERGLCASKKEQRSDVCEGAGQVPDFAISRIEREPYKPQDTRHRPSQSPLRCP